MTRTNSILEAHLVIIQDEKVLMLRRYNTGYEDGNYSLVAGHVEADECGSQAMIREAKEEAGIDLQLKDLALFHVMHRNSGGNRVSFFFTTEQWSGQIQNMEPHKCDDLSWFALNSLPENTVPYISFALDLGSKGIKYSDYGWIDDA